MQDPRADSRPPWLFHRLVQRWRTCPVGEPPGREVRPDDAIQEAYAGRDPRIWSCPSTVGKHGLRGHRRAMTLTWKSRSVKGERPMSCARVTLAGGLVALALAGPAPPAPAQEMPVRFHATAVNMSNVGRQGMHGLD